MSVPSRYLRAAGAHAEIDMDAHNDGAFILSIGGAQQSHVDLADPRNVFYEYLRRIANVLDVFKPAGQPIRVLHLGAGALTLARYVQATRPGSRQVAVERERELLAFVVEHLPLPPGTDCELLVEDASDTLTACTEGAFDAVVLDVFSGADGATELATPEVYRLLTRAAAPGGVVLVNVGDDPPLTFAREQALLLLETGYDVAALGETAMFTGQHAGNIVLAASTWWNPAWTAPLAAAGPHPAALLTGADYTDFAGRKR
ncbi:spermidine synthase [Arthrobacter sp. Soil782]|uniref:spermidine synthase n=1 Tax=Arthrobacter sp. Soil782 TaxID=1736410 RepID=UPI000B10E467